MPDFIDIHTHTFYESAHTKILLNVFAGDTENLKKPVLKSVGLHPWHIRKETYKDLLIGVEEKAKHESIVAIGETGLDKAIEPDYELQKEVFAGHINVAEKLRKPLIIHCVRSYSEMLSYRKSSDRSIPWIFHWFNADKQTAQELIRKNCYLSFGHMLFNEKSKAFRVFTEIPPENIFFETDDAGYAITEIYEKAAFLRKISVEDLKMAIMANFVRCFHI